MLKKYTLLPPIFKIVIPLVLALLVFIIYRSYSANKSSQPQYLTSKVERGNIVVSLSASGSVSTANSRTVTTTASGVVKKIYAKEGDKVTTGTPLLEIDLDLNGRQKFQSAYSSYLSAQNSYQSAQDKFYSLQSDLVSAQNIFVNQWSMQSPDDPTYIQKHNTYLTAQAAFDNLQNTLKQSRASLESSRLSYQLAGAVVYAPISGTISAISLTPGMILNPTSDSANSSNSENKIAIVRTKAAPAIALSLTEIDVPKVKVGNLATVILDALPTKTFTGKIIAIDTTGTVSSGVVSYPVTILLDTDAPGILPNMSATVNIITNFKNDVLMVPSAAIQTQNNATTVRVMINSQVQSKPVEIGLQSDTYTEIVTGLNEGEDVVTSVTIPSATTNSSQSSSVFGGGLGGGARFIGR